MDMATARQSVKWHYKAEEGALGLTVALLSYWLKTCDEQPVVRIINHLPMSRPI